jgi:hypothetical protein
MRRLLSVLVAALAVAVAHAADPKPVELYNGKDLSGWKPHGDAKKNHWHTICAVGVNEQKPEELAFGIGDSVNGSILHMVNSPGGGVNIATEQKFGDCTLVVEFMIPKGSNSGVYLMGEYEVQILDSFGKEKPDKGDLGAIYGVTAPKVNAAKKPGEWQKFVIDFQAPRFEGGKKTANAKFLKVLLNDQVIQENVEVPGPTTAALTGKEAPTGPLMLQGDHGPVAFRGIKITPR